MTDFASLWQARANSRSPGCFTMLCYRLAIALNRQSGGHALANLVGWARCC